MRNAEREGIEGQDFADVLFAHLMNGCNATEAATATVALFLKDGKWQYRPPDGRMRSRAWQALRQEILERDEWICAYCGDDATQVDHIRAVVNGGSNSPGNLTACCAFCNSSKGAKNVAEWMRQ